jgi:hypothetical protein
VPLSERELETLREIVAYWLQEGVVVPPYPAELTAVLDKLGMAGDAAARPAAAVAAVAAPPARPLRPNLG